jgi:hypothetical protein
MNEDKTTKSSTDEQPTIAQPTADRTTEDSAAASDQSEPSVTPTTTDEQPTIAQPTADRTTEGSAAASDQSELSGTPSSEFLQADVSANTAAEEFTHSEATSGTETPPEEPVTSAPQSEQTAVTESETEKPVLTKSPFEKPDVDEAKIELLVAEVIKGEKINQLNQKKLANLLKKLSDGMNDSGELSAPFTIGARDILVGPAANRMLSQGISGKQSKKAFLEAGINLVSVQHQIAARAQQTEDQPLPIITSRRVKRAQKAEAFCGLYPWC